MEHFKLFIELFKSEKSPSDMKKAYHTGYLVKYNRVNSPQRDISVWRNKVSKIDPLSSEIKVRVKL